MKPGIHPEYVESKVSCACGNAWTTRSTKPIIKTDVCSQCHPFFTGEQRIVDSAGQVERFVRRVERSQQLQQEKEQLSQAKDERRKARLLIELPEDEPEVEAEVEVEVEEVEAGLPAEEAE